MPNPLQQTNPGLPLVRRDKPTLERFLCRVLVKSTAVVGLQSSFVTTCTPIMVPFFFGTQIRDEREHLTDYSELWSKSMCRG